MAAPYIYVIGNCVPYDIKTLREDATGAQMKMQADACAHQRAKSRKATYDIKTLREDATGAQMKMQADACAHQRAKSRKATLCSDILS